MVGNDISVWDVGWCIVCFDLLIQKVMDWIMLVGFWIVIFDELGVEGQLELDMCLKVNGQLCQQDNSCEMIFFVDELFNYFDVCISLCLGDLVFIGLIYGVGLEDGCFLMLGDWVEVYIDGFGMLGNCIGF